MSVTRVLLTASCLTAWVAGPGIRPAEAASIFASEVVSYNKGATYVSGYTNPNVSLGSPDGLTGETYGYLNVLSPFSPAYEPDEIVTIGEGGHLTLKFPNFAVAGPDREIGVIANFGLMDASWPSGVATNPASGFGDYSGVVEVSEDGVDWKSLGTIRFCMPANYYLDSGPYDMTAGSQPADFSKPFFTAGGLADFNGKTHAQVLAMLNGSGGGTWLDISPTGLTQVAYIRFSVPDDGDPLENNYLVIDAVVIGGASVGQPVPVPVPEPAAVALLAGGAGLLVLSARRRARRSRPEN